MDRLLSYFCDGLEKPSGSVGAEIETPFMCGKEPASLSQSQKVFGTLVDQGWNIRQKKGALLTAIADASGNTLLYELGRQNIELATAPTTASNLLASTKRILEQLYEVAAGHGLIPSFSPILDTEEDLLVIPDERDATWLALDGREALAPLARISAVQFTVEVSRERAVTCLNALGGRMSLFLADYPQDDVWREYIRKSLAGYQTLRYGGPLLFDGLEDYCEQLSMHEVVLGPRLVPFGQAELFDIPLFLRSIWWYFRLKRYGNRLCIEVRPLARRDDSRLDVQLQMVLEVLAL